mmetsp:Transcript_9450/g.28195  ORF Transcript_9450/g.28195 Transcript_9450/m.28195 type:complete len:403 (+) Transcript_9450:171-1379(+)
MSNIRREEKESFCTWPRILVLVVLLIVGGVCVWWFVPWDDTINKVLNNVEGDDDNESSGNNGAIGGNGVPNTIIPLREATLAPSVAPKYDFIQCNPEDTQSNCCNGLEGLCDLRVNEILYATLHNGMATFEDGFLFGPNHKYQLEGALEAGYRGLNLDICNCGGEVIFCHGICALGPREITDVMRSVNEFLDENPTEVIVFVYQVDNDAGQDVDLNQFYDQLLLVDGFLNKLYVHPGAGVPWPTLGQLTDPEFNKRVVMFHYGGPNCNLDPPACPDGLHLYYNYGSDNYWEHLNVASIENRLNSCELTINGINRKDFVGLNNFVSPPSQTSAEKVNAYSSAMDYVDTCTELLSTDINFLLVDFWSVGDVPRVTQDHNAFLIQRRRTEERNLLQIVSNITEAE